MTKPKIILAEQSVIIRKGIKAVLTELGQFDVVKELTDWNAVIRSVNKNQPNYLIFNFNLLPNEAYQSIASYFEADLDILFIVIYEKNIPDNIKAQCKNSIKIYDDESIIYNSLKHLFTNSENKDKNESSGLSKRENDVVKCIALGMTNKEIAGNLYISTHTVIAHRKNITRKLGIKTVSGLTVYAILNKLVELNEIEKQ